MTDTYLDLVNSGLGKEVASKLGLPRPSVLRRHTAGEPVAAGTVLVLGSSAGASAVAAHLLDEGADVRRSDDTSTTYAAIVMGLDDATAPRDLHPVVLEAAGALKRMDAGSRVIVLTRPAGHDDPEIAAVRAGTVGMMRSVAHEMRRGGTANAVVIEDGLEATAPSVLGAVRFFLSGRSAYVSGQPLLVSSAAGRLPLDPERPLDGKIAVVTGAARGIGAAIAKTLRRDGAQVIVVDIPAAGEQLAKVANEVQGTALQLDITAEDAGERILAHARQRYGWLDIVVHNAGITRDKLLANMDESRWDSVMAVNIESQLRMNRAFAASESFARDGRIVCLASTSGIAGNRGQSNYAASKAGVIGMVAASSAALTEHGGSINAVAPGFIETDMTAKIPFLTREVARRLSSLQQGGLPQDVAEAIAFLASDAAAGVSGQTLRVCGQNLVGA
ncbi:3-oxoacyl-ACP reductase [Falsarthrobacter nasiphocae]|uniref:3-oxoacyl-[acyl-carrier protein] reductase n=1 Tax=Falsarthrobacter nasiphocae TaxID=189863 RepID=A0AAE3YG28_9MICC|nr:3-oxoacyl-ACP reductase [Falsarthrobacter nasiphocae]MDR6891121.1 3-oxoacyl-[acyl-carrier protein] reductase [Falsarthrobacter nasiphocae]